MCKDIEQQVLSENYKWILSRIDSYIALMDTKCEILLAAVSLGVGAAASNDGFISKMMSALHHSYGNCVFLLALSCILACLTSIIFIGLALFPRTDSNQERPSRLFFGDITRFKSIDDYMQSYENSERSCKDFAGEIFECSKICNKKLVWHRRAFECVVVTLVFVILLLMVTFK